YFLSSFFTSSFFVAFCFFLFFKSSSLISLKPLAISSFAFRSVSVRKITLFLRKIRTVYPSQNNLFNQLHFWQRHSNFGAISHMKNKLVRVCVKRDVVDSTTVCTVRSCRTLGTLFSLRTLWTLRTLRTSQITNHVPCAVLILVEVAAISVKVHISRRSQ